MEIANLWPEKVDNSVIILLEKWIEKRSYCNLRSGSSLPKEATRYTTRIFRNKQDQRCFIIEKIEGLEEGRSTKGKFHTRVDEFGYIFRKLTDREQISLLIYCDPFDELEERESRLKEIKKNGFSNEGKFLKEVGNILEKLQDMCVSAGIVEDLNHKKQMTDFKKIAKKLKVTVPTVKKILKILDK